MFPALPELGPLLQCPKRWGATNTCTQKGVAPYKCFQLLGSFEAPNQEFKLEKVQLAAGTAFGNGELLTSASCNTDNQISCLVL